MDGQNYWEIKRFSIFYNFYAYIDAAGYLADQLFVKHRVRIGFIREYGKKGSGYRVILCRVRKKDREGFTDAMGELKNSMLLTGHRDYVESCNVMGDAFVKAAGMRQDT